MKWGYMNKIEAESKIRKYEEKTESEFESLKKKWEEGDFLWKLKQKSIRI